MTDKRVSAVYMREFPARAEDCDELGHVSNLVYLRWVLEAAQAHSEAVGWSLQRYLEAGTVWVVRSHEITYLRPAQPGDPIEVRTWVESFKAASSPRCTEILRASDGTLLARARTIWALMGTKNGRPCRIPPEMRADFGRAVGDAASE